MTTTIEDMLTEEYSFFFSIVSGNRDYHRSFDELQPSQQRVIKNFIKFLEKYTKTLPIDRYWLRDYVGFQFSRNFSQNTRFGKGNVFLNRVYTRSAYGKYIVRTDEEAFYQQQFLNRFEITPIQDEYSGDSESREFREENDRRLYKDKDEKLALCLETTSGYSNKSITCRLCTERNNCKQLSLKI